MSTTPHHDDFAKVLAAALEVQPERQRAENFIKTEPIPAFAGRTLLQLVAEGRTDAAISYIGSISSGFVGQFSAPARWQAFGGFLHDLGKIGVPDSVLRKAGPLDDSEWQVMRTHPQVGLRLLSAHSLAYWITDAVGAHHERFDGRGYPGGLAGTAIPVAARIVGICDAFDALTSARPYRPAMPIAAALDILEAQSGTQFDADLDARFVRIGRDGQWSHIAGHSDDGIPLLHCPHCGPTLVRTREAREGQGLYCRNCSSAFVLVRSGGGLQAQPTGAVAAAGDLIADADHALLRRLLEEFAALRLWTLPAAGGA